MSTVKRRREAPRNRAIRASAVLGLQRIEILKGLDARTLREVADRCAWRRFRRNEHVTRNDRADRDVHFVISGQVRVSAESGRGREIILRDLPAGELFGEHSAIDGRARIGDVVAVRESLLASMPPEAFRALLASHASVREQVLRRLSRSVRELAGRLVDLGTQRVQSRIWVELLRLAQGAVVESNAARIEHAPTHREIANRLGTSREEVTRELSRLNRKGLLDRAGRALVLRDVAALRQLAATYRVEPEPVLETLAADVSVLENVRSRRERRAILVAAAIDTVAMMERDEERTIQRWRAFFEYAHSQEIPARAGRSLSKLQSGELMADFPDGAHALECAFELHRGLGRFNAQTTAPRLALRVGIHLADVIIETFDLLGDGVNVAARLAELANPGETLVSAPVRDQLANGVDATLEDLGEQRLRNRERAVRVFRAWPADGRAQLAPSAAVMAHGRPSVAVIPFQVRSIEPRFEFLGDAVAEEVIGALSRVADFFVVSRLSSMAFRRAPLNLQTVGEMLGVRYVLSGSVQTAYPRALLVAELADTNDGKVLWNERFECDLVDAFALQMELARKVVGSVAPFVRSFELHRARITNLDQLDAYALTLRGIDLMYRLTSEDFLSARRVLETAIERDPLSPAPHAYLANWHLIGLAIGASADPAAEALAATQCAERALACDRNAALALAVAGMVSAWSKHDLDTAERHLTQAIAANPNEPLAWLWNAMVHAWRGRGAEAIQAADRALTLSPLDPMTYYFNSLASTANLVGERYDRAIELATRSLRENRLHTPTLRALAVALTLTGRRNEAREVVQELRELEPGLTVSGFGSRYPGRDSPQAARFAAALLDAGLPP